MPPETPMERLEAKAEQLAQFPAYADANRDGWFATMPPDVAESATEEAADLRWALSEITRLTADCARKDLALEPFANQPFADPSADYREGLHVMRGLTIAHFRAAASARGEGSGR